MAWSRTSRHDRGYGSDWDIIRARIIKRDKGLCQACLARGRVTIGREVDHKMPKAEAKKKGWTKEQMDADGNLWLLCKPCHDHKTAQENGRVYRPRQATGEDGWPVDKA